ncbi:MAG: DMT family transporter [Deltaproteobacteria bacterium]|nr:DMT family transporter [Deltaproteobacteria bacterium]
MRPLARRGPEARGAAAEGFNFGDALTVPCALFTAGHVVLTGHVSNRVPAIRFVTVQIATVGIACLAIAIVRGSLPDTRTFLSTLPFAMCGILSVSAGYLVLTSAQRRVRAADAAMIMQLEGVSAAVCGMVFLDETMTPPMWAGAAMLAVGAFMSVLPAPEGAAGLGGRGPSVPRLGRGSGRAHPPAAGRGQPRGLRDDRRRAFRVPSGALLTGLPGEGAS